MFRGVYELELNMKIAALKASPFVVSLVSFTGEVVVSRSCGAIIETEGNTNTVITSLNLVRKPSKREAQYAENILADNLKIVIHANDENSYIGKIFCYDFHFNLVIIKFRSKCYFQSANLMMIDDHSGVEKGFQLHRSPSKANSGDNVIVVGRYFYEPYNFMAASGLLSLERFRPEQYDCNELLTITCRFDSVGLFSILDFHSVQGASIRHPSYGFDGRNLYSAILPTLAKFLRLFPNISNGVIVEKVFKEYCASCIMGSKYLMWDKVGKIVEFEVARLELKTVMSIKMLIGQASPEELNEYVSIVVFN
ncbi:uncharacterized protein LOC141651055 [Silene latifolia]|uniref:uncharacterized protein LOC141651055 n=1 Tax=Silene latifolia TaxID=37657 RepID=UPI003D774E52